MRVVSSREDSSVGMMTRYGLDGPRVESRWVAKIFLTLRDRPTHLYTGYRFFLPGVNQPGRGVDHRPPSSAEVKERVKL